MEFPIFPLNGAILFPKTNLPLNIFEERYVEMIDYALSNKRLVGMIQIKENGSYFSIGCLGKITNFTETEDGRYQINLQGLKRFSLKKILKNNYKFKLISAEILETQNNIEIEKKLNEKLLSYFKKFLSFKKISFDTSEFENLDAASLAKIICVISPLDYLTKQMLLEFDNYNDFCSNLISVLEIEMQNFEKNLKIN